MMRATGVDAHISVFGGCFDKGSEQASRRFFDEEKLSRLVHTFEAAVRAGVLVGLREFASVCERALGTYRKRVGIRNATILLGFLSVFPVNAFAAVWCVDKDNASGTQDGASPATTYTAIQPPIDAASIDFQANGGPPEIWVAEGVYVEAWIIVPYFPPVSTNSVVNVIDEGER